MRMTLHQYHDGMPFVYTCILCDEVYHDTELLMPGVPPVCHKCRKEEEDAARTCYNCGDPVYFESPVCHVCESRLACNAEMPAEVAR